ncbi:MAG: SDR family oxidoreductase [Rhodothermia bacterium]|nr:SDR family oxidoreductase [Rhodothermia bacterium]
MIKDRSDAQRVVVTGGGGRLGSKLVRRFLDDGANVAAIVISDEEAARVPSAETTALVKIADVTDEDSVVTAFEELHDELGGLDAVIHTVGMWGQEVFAKTRLSSWEKMMSVNLTSAFLCFREAVRHMGDGGTLIAITSRQGADRGVGGQAAYSAAKAGIIRLVEAVADEHASSGITAHAIAPSTILFEEEGDGVQASEVVSLVVYLTNHGPSLDGATVRAYGSG